MGMRCEGHAFAPVAEYLHALDWFFGSQELKRELRGEESSVVNLSPHNQKDRLKAMRWRGDGPHLLLRLESVAYESEFGGMVDLWPGVTVLHCGRSLGALGR
jgi:hypothetical protein